MTRRRFVGPGLLRLSTEEATRLNARGGIDTGMAASSALVAYRAGVSEPEEPLGGRKAEAEQSDTSQEDSRRRDLNGKAIIVNEKDATPSV